MCRRPVRPFHKKVTCPAFYPDRVIYFLCVDTEESLIVIFIFYLLLHLLIAVVER